MNSMELHIKSATPRQGVDLLVALFAQLPGPGWATALADDLDNVCYCYCDAVRRLYPDARLGCHVHRRD